MQVDVWSDVVCPWCYVGLANLDQALDDFEHADDVEVVLHSFQLDPAAPRRDPEPQVERLARKYRTSLEEIRTNQARLVALGAERGIDFRFDDAVGGNTFDAHRLLHLGLRRGVQRKLKHRLGEAYFTEGQPIGETDTLRAAALAVGLDADEVEAVLTGDAFADEVRTDIADAQRIGVSGVPFFVAGGRLAVSGAQPPEALLDVLRQAWADQQPVPTVVAGGDDNDNDEVCGPEGCEV